LRYTVFGGSSYDAGSIETTWSLVSALYLGYK